MTLVWCANHGGWVPVVRRQRGGPSVASHRYPRQRDGSRPYCQGSFNIVHRESQTRPWPKEER